MSSSMFHVVCHELFNGSVMVHGRQAGIRGDPGDFCRLHSKTRHPGRSILPTNRVAQRGQNGLGASPPVTGSGARR